MKNNFKIIVLMLVGMQDVGAMKIEKLGNRGDQSLSVCAMNQQYCSVRR